MSRNEPNSSIFLKDLLLKKSKSFCILPWVHLHTTPTGVAAPCCISSSCATIEGVGNSRENSLNDLINSSKMNQLRLDMLTGTLNSECTKCHQHEDQNVNSARQMNNNRFEHAMDDVVTNTNLSDGSLKEFKMRYFDIRFSNICNFKCRTCGSEFSTQWEQEDLKNNVIYAKILPKNNNPKFLQDVIDQIGNMEEVYFAGGEPLITEEHYILLEEMIKTGNTGIRLRYNTNISNFKFKDKDILGLWKYFKNRVDVYASIDHYGPRAEYIRHGTVWETVKENFMKAKETPHISIKINTVLSVYNYLTIDLFYKYLVDNKMYTPNDSVYTLYNMSTPNHMACHMLPPEYKVKGNEALNRAIDYLQEKGFKERHLEQLYSSVQWTNSQHTWEIEKDIFRKETKRLDAIRGENFMHTFPEIADLYKPDRNTLWPV